MASHSKFVFKSNFNAFSRQAQAAYTTALNDCIDDLVRTSSQSAPHDEGILEKSWSKEVTLNGNEPQGTVSFTVKKQGGKGKKNGNFNYALKMHEGNYNLGEKSLRKAGGTGMSGKTYPVGAGYLGGVLKGEEQAYRNHIENELGKVANRYR